MKRINPSIRFERVRFSAALGPASLFERVMFVMSGHRTLRADGPHFRKRVKERSIPTEVVQMATNFNSADWTLLSAEVRVDKGKFIASAWGRKWKGRNYVIIVGLGDVLETIYDSALPFEDIHACRLGGVSPDSPFGRFVEQVNRDLMMTEKAAIS